MRLVVIAVQQSHTQGDVPTRQLCAPACVGHCLAESAAELRLPLVDDPDEIAIALSLFHSTVLFVHSVHLRYCRFTP